MKSNKLHIGLVVVGTILTVTACGNESVSTDISTEGVANEDTLTSSKNVVQVDNSAVSDIYYGTGLIDLTNKTGDELFANVYWVGTNALPYKGRRISYNGYTQSEVSDIMEEEYYSVAVSTDIYKEFTGQEEPDYTGFEYKLDSGEYPEDGIYVNITGDISYYTVTDDDGNETYYSILENVEIKQLEEN